MGGTRSLSTLPKCGRCGLYKTCTSPKMKPSGQGKRSVLFVGEAPGETEDEEGTQFVGQAGQHLRFMLEDIGVGLDQCYKTNAAICRPPKNVMDDVYIESCRPNLMNTIRDLKPSVIILLGHAAVKSLVVPEWREDIGPMGRWVGWQIPSMVHNAWVCPTYHPSHLCGPIRPGAAKDTKRHLRAAMGLEGRPVIGATQADLSREVEVILDPRQPSSAYASWRPKDGYLAWDLRNHGLKARTQRAADLLDLILPKRYRYLCLPCR